MLKVTTKGTRKYLHIGKVRISASRFPWQVRAGQAMLSNPITEKMGTKYGWRGTDGMGRFGAGWNWKLGFAIGGKTIMLDCLVGSITITWYPDRG